MKPPLTTPFFRMLQISRTVCPITNNQDNCVLHETLFQSKMSYIPTTHFSKKRKSHFSARQVMYNHEPAEYTCPFCYISNQLHLPDNAGVFYSDPYLFAIVSKHWWPNNPGHVLIVPRAHIENIYELPFHLSDKIHRFAKYAALALKAVYKCDGISTRQHNEPAGNQDVWHYHLHVFPRYTNDQLYLSRKMSAAPLPERLRYARLLQDYFDANPPDLETDR